MKRTLDQNLFKSDKHTDDSSTSNATTSDVIPFEPISTTYAQNAIPVIYTNTSIIETAWFKSNNKFNYEINGASDHLMQPHPFYPNLSKDCLQKIISYTANDDYQEESRVVAKLSLVCKKNYFFFRNERANRKKITPLLAVLHDNTEDVLYLARNYPDLFFITIKEEVKDYASDLKGNCRTIIGGWSAYQAIFGTGSTHLLSSNGKEQQIRQALTEYLDSLPNDSGWELAFSQEQEKFPNGFHYPPSYYDFSKLCDVITKDQQLITLGQNMNETTFVDLQKLINSIDDNTLVEFEKFRSDFKPEPVTTGYHFNMNHYINAVDCYEKNAQLWNRFQCECYQLYIIGFLQRLLPATFINQIRNKTEKSGRCNSFYNPKTQGKKYDPSETLGVHFYLHDIYSAKFWDHQIIVIGDQFQKMRIQSPDKSIELRQANTNTAKPNLLPH